MSFGRTISAMERILSLTVTGSAVPWAWMFERTALGGNAAIGGANSLDDLVEVGIPGRVDLEYMFTARTLQRLHNCASALLLDEGADFLNVL